MALAPSENILSQGGPCCRLPGQTAQCVCVYECGGVFLCLLQPSGSFSMLGEKLEMSQIMFRRKAPGSTSGRTGSISHSTSQKKSSSWFGELPPLGHKPGDWRENRVSVTFILQASHRLCLTSVAIAGPGEGMVSFIDKWQPFLVSYSVPSPPALVQEELTRNQNDQFVFESVLSHPAWHPFYRPSHGRCEKWPKDPQVRRKACSVPG